MAYEETLAIFRRGDNAETERLAKADLSIARANGDTSGEVNALCMLARVSLRTGHLGLVDEYARQGQDVADSEADRALGRMPLHLRAVAARMSGHYDDARHLYLESIGLNDALGEQAMVAAECRNLAYVEVHAGNVTRAFELFAEAQRRAARTGSLVLAPYLAVDEATVASLRSDHATAKAKLQEAEEQFLQQGVVPDPDDAAEIAELRRRLIDR